MPQLDTVYTLTIYLWTWFMLYLIMQKIKTVSIMKSPTPTQSLNHKKLTPPLPWT